MISKNVTLKKLFEIFFILSFLIAGMAYSLLPVLEGSHRFIPGDLIDSRIVHLLLEHGYASLIGGMDTVWDASWLFFPYKNNITLTESMIGAVPFYLPFRLSGFGPAESYQMWFVLVALLNFISCFFLLRTLRCSIHGASAGAFIFSFSMPVSALINHPQLTLRFFIPASLVFLIYYTHAVRRIHRAVYFLLFSALLSWQFWACNYTGWFYLFFLFVFFITAMLYQENRKFLFAALKKDFLIFAAGGIISFAAVLPLLLRLKAHASVRDWADVLSYTSRVQSFFYPHSGSFVYRSFLEYFNNGTDKGLYTLFPGFLATGILLYKIGEPIYNRFVVRKTDPEIANKDKNCNSIGNSENSVFEKYSSVLSLPLAVTAAFMILSVIRVDDFTLWKWIYYTFPGANGIRAVSRVIFVAILPVSVLTAFVITALEKNKKTGFVYSILFSVIILFENSHFTSHNYSKNDHFQLVTKAEELLRKNGECRVFYYRDTGMVSLISHVDAMWASFNTGIPTINGYSGGTPPGWNFDRLESVSVRDLSGWLALGGVDIPEKNICIFVLY